MNQDATWQNVEQMKHCGYFLFNTSNFNPHRCNMVVKTPRMLVLKWWSRSSTDSAVILDIIAMASINIVLVCSLKCVFLIVFHLAWVTEVISSSKKTQKWLDRASSTTTLIKIILRSSPWNYHNWIKSTFLQKPVYQQNQTKVSLKDTSNSPGLIYSRCLKDQRDDTTFIFFSDYQKDDRN